jgi:hypothetical protein
MKKKPFYKVWVSNAINAVGYVARFINGVATIELNQFAPVLQDAAAATSNGGTVQTVSIIIIPILLWQ